MDIITRCSEILSMNSAANVFFIFDIFIHKSIEFNKRPQ